MGEAPPVSHVSRTTKTHVPPKAFGYHSSRKHENKPARLEKYMRVIAAAPQNSMSSTGRGAFVCAGTASRRRRIVNNGEQVLGVRYDDNFLLLGAQP